jgi:RNA polymerase sigma factor (sigma-70 family)
MRTEDGSIISRCLNGEPEAFGLLVDKYKTGIYAYVYVKIRNFHDAQDVTQEVFIQAFRDLRNLKRWDSFVFWLYRIASARCSNWQRAKSRYPDSEFIEDQDPQKLEAPSVDSYRENQMYEWLQESLDSLPEAYREVLMLHYFAGMKSDEIASSLSISPASVRMRLSRARSQLKEDMLTMMRATFEEQRLPVTFTFRIVEAIKRIKIQPVSTTKGVPWGISIVAGIIFTFLSLGSRIMVSQDIGIPISFSLPSESKVLNIGEIPVDVMKKSNIASISNPMGKGGESKRPDMQNAFMAPQAEGGTWVKKADMPIGFGYNCFSVVNDKIYAIGGSSIINGKEVALSTVYEYDPKADIWSNKADMPTPRGYFGTGVVNGKIYAIGGWNWTNQLSAVEEYDPIANKWNKKSDCPTKISGLTVSQVNGKIYVMGGNDGGLSFTAVLEYDPKTDTWTKKADMPTGRSFLTSCVLNNKIYVFGGANDGDVSKILSTVEIYDPTTDTWSKGSDMPKARVLIASCTVNGLIYVMGGWDKIGNLSIVEIYDPKNDKWIEGENMPIPRDAMSSYPEVNGKIYVIGGYSNIRYLSDTWEFTPEALQSAVSSQGKLPKTWGNIKSK